MASERANKIKKKQKNEKEEEEEEEEEEEWPTRRATGAQRRLASEGLQQRAQKFLPRSPSPSPSLSVSINCLSAALSGRVTVALWRCQQQQHHHHHRHFNCKKSIAIDCCCEPSHRLSQITDSLRPPSSTPPPVSFFIWESWRILKNLGGGLGPTSENLKKKSQEWAIDGAGVSVEANKVSLKACILQALQANPHANEKNGWNSIKSIDVYYIVSAWRCGEDLWNGKG